MYLSSNRFTEGTTGDFRGKIKNSPEADFRKDECSKKKLYQMHLT